MYVYNVQYGLLFHFQKAHKEETFAHMLGERKKEENEKFELVILILINLECQAIQADNRCNNIQRLTGNCNYYVSFDVSPVFQINQSVMEAALSPDMLATDLAYYLVRKGVSSV